jgi:hypothetical protein
VLNFQKFILKVFASIPKCVSGMEDLPEFQISRPDDVVVLFDDAQYVIVFII